MFDKKLERTILKRGCRTVYAHITSKLIAIAQVQIKLQILEELTDFLPERSDRKQQQQSTFYTFIIQFHSPFPNSPLLYFIHVFNFHLRCASSSFSSEQKRPLEPISSAHGSRHCVKVRRNSVYTYNRRRETFLVGAFQGTHTFVHFYTVHERVGDLQGNGSSPCPRPISVEYPRKQTPFSPEGNLVSGFLRLGPGA